MNIYVSAKYEEAPRARAIMQELRHRGHTITCDWTEHSLTSTRQAQAEFDKAGVMAAEAFVLLQEKHYVTDYPVGHAVEFGMALARGIPVYILGEEGRESVFFYLPGVRFIPDVSHIPRAI